MFGTIRRHSKWLWGVIITVTVLSFVVYFSPYSRFGNGPDTGAGNFGSINGHKITRQDYLDALREVNFRYFLNRGVWPDRDPQAKQQNWNPEREVYYRLLLLQKAHDFGIQAGTDTAAQLALNIMRQTGAPTLEALEQKLLLPYLTIADLERFAKNEIVLQQLVGTVGLGGTLMVPAEAQMLYRFDNQEASAQLAFVPATNYLASVAVTPAALVQFYTNRAESYRIPSRVQVNYVKYDVTNYFTLATQVVHSRVTNFPALFEAVYEQRGSNYFKGKPLNEVTNQIYADVVRNFALELARTNAAGLLYELSDQDTVTSSNLLATARSRGLQARVTTPFDNVTGLQDIEVPPAFVQKAFSLTDKEPVGGPIVAEDGVYVIGLANTIPSYVPPFTSVSNRVRNDFLAVESNRLAHQAGEAAYAALTNGLAQGKEFSRLTREAGFRWYPLNPFSRSTRSLADFDLAPMGLLQETAFKVPAGHVSQFVPLTYGGFFLYVKELLPMNEKQMQDAMPEFVAALRQNGQGELFNAWFRKQAETGLRDTPLNRPPPPTMGAAPRSR